MGTVSNDEVKAALTEIQKSFEEHKKINEARLDAIAREKSTSDFDEKLARINDAISKQEDVHRRWMREQERLSEKKALEEKEFQLKQQEAERKMEARINRAVLGLGGNAMEDARLDEKLKWKVYEKYLRFGEAKALSSEEQKVLQVSNDPAGGYLAPPTFIQDIIKAVVLYSPMRSLVNVIKSGSTEVQLPKRTRTAAATRVGEASTRSESQNPLWGLMKLTAPEMYAEARVTQANLEDSAFNLEQLLSDEFSEQFGVLEGYEVINGTGVGECLGFLDASAAGPSTPIAYTVSGGATTIAGASGSEADGLINLFHNVKTAYASKGTWVLNRASLGKVRLLKDTAGRYLWQAGGNPSGVGGLDASAPGTILGAPYVEAPDMPNEGSGAFPIAFGDWKRAYTLVDRVELAITRDPFTLASTGQVKFFARRRVGGQVVLGEAIRLLKCST